MTPSENMNIAITVIAAMTMIATVVGPLLAVLIQYRLAHPKPKPDENHPKNLIQRIGGWVASFILSPWLIGIYVFGIGFNVYRIILEVLRNDVLVDRIDVIYIAFVACSLLFAFIAILFHGAFLVLLKIIKTVNHNAAVTGNMRGVVREMILAYEQPSTSLLDQLSPAAKNLFKWER